MPPNTQPNLPTTGGGTAADIIVPATIREFAALAVGREAARAGPTLPQHARPVQNYGLEVIKKVEGALLADANTTTPPHPRQPSAELPTYAVVIDKLAGMLQELTGEQRDILNKITAYIANRQHGPGQLQLILGPPGSGKTHLVNMLSTVGASSTPCFAVEAVAYTGIAASLIGGATINSHFSIPIEAGNTG